MLALGAGHVTHSVEAADRPVSPLLIRRQTQGRIVNFWLVLIVIVGAAIAVADGLTRTPILDQQESWNGPLEYQPHLAALLFATGTFPLMIGYVRKARVSLNVGLFLWFVFCTVAYTKDFSYLRWPGAPLFVTDVVLLVLLASIFSLPRPHYRRTPMAVNLLLLLLLGAGVLAGARGFWGRRDTMLVLRDSALVVYPLYLFVGYHLFRSWISIKRLAVWFLLGAALASLNAIAWFVVAPGERRFIYYGIYILIALAGTVVAMASRLLRKRAGWIFAGTLCLGLMLANARSLFVSLAVLLFMGLFGSRVIRTKIRAAHLVATAVTVTMLLGTMAFVFLHTEAGRDFAERATEDLASGVLNSGEDANWQFRVSAWKEAWRRFEEYPMAGEGFGIPFTFEPSPLDNDPRPHNTFLTVLYKMGLSGLLPLLALLLYFFLTALRAVHCHSQKRCVVFLQIAILAQVALCIYGSANLLLESPFLASLFWVGSGVGLRMSKMLDLERSLREYSYGC